jgi:hypothetical protein
MNDRDPSAVWQRLTELYASKLDEELLELREDFDDLTDVAQGVLRDELRKRRLWSDVPGSESKAKQIAQRYTTSPTEDPLDEDLVDLIRVGGVKVYESDDRNDASLIWYVLRRANIPAALTRKEHDFDLRLPQVRVSPDDVERALAIIGQPIPDVIRQDYELESAAETEEWLLPNCKRCSAPDPLLESASPTNTWRCEECGATWQDPLPPA